jgi:hypothetical protein
MVWTQVTFMSYWGMAKALDLTGWRRGRLVGLEAAPRRPGETMWRWQCDCGKQVEIAIRNVRQGKTRSCGCLHDEIRRTATRTHGHTANSPTPTMRSYWAMKTRCYNPRANNYHRYGGRGITVCDDWRDSFATFLADMGPRPPGTTLDRIDPEKGYDLSNTRWATVEQQGRGRRNILGEHTGGRSLRAWAAIQGLHYPTLQYHYRTAGKPFAEAVAATRTPSHLSRRRSARAGRSTSAAASADQN